MAARKPTTMEKRPKRNRLIATVDESRRLAIRSILRNVAAGCVHLPSMSLSLSLPPPRKSVPKPITSHDPESNLNKQREPENTAKSSVHLPSYEQRCHDALQHSKLTPQERKTAKKLFVPRSLTDFGDGGAYPEIPVAQYPRHMGNPHVNKLSSADQANGSSTGAPSSSRALMNVTIDADGSVGYDAIVKSGTNRDRIVYSKHADLRGGPGDADALALATPEEEAQTAAKTQAALLALLNPSDGKEEKDDKQFIQYTANPEAPGFNPAAANRVIQLVPKQVDPLNPPKHKHVKAPPGPAEDPVPVLHAPTTKKLTKEERDAWNVPACISNWKNPRGYTIPLDKRLAADGRTAAKDVTINPNFATLSESLYVAERHARQEVKLRAQVQAKAALQQKQSREEELRELARQARLERGGAAPASTTKPGGALSALVEDASDSSGDESAVRRNSQIHHTRNDEEGNDDEDAVAARQRDRLRMERKRERERELRLSRKGNKEDGEAALKKQRLESERDVSEKIALGVHTGTGGGAGADVDARLYNQSAGLSSGFGADDEYNTYSKPLFGNTSASSGSIYRPTRNAASMDGDVQYDALVKGATTRFQPDKGFQGAQGGSSTAPRNAPVQFEKGN